jgi:glycosyltransferase involved in cell wall biosynthesis
VSTVVHLFGAMDAGGAETRLLEELGRRTGRETHVCVTLSGRAGSLAPRFADLGVEVVPRRLSPTWPFWFVRFLRDRGATHVHSHVQLASGYLLAAAMAAGVRRRIAHLHSVHDERSDRGWRVAYRAVARLLLRVCATDVVAVSESVRDAVVGGTPLARRTRVVVDRIDGDRFPLAPPGPSASGPQLIVVGRLGADKGQVRAVEVLAAVRARRPDARLLLAGRDDEPDRSAVLRRAVELGVGEAVEVLGARDDVPELLASSDLLLTTSRREGLPGSVMEAAAAGIPAVASAIPPCDEAAFHLPSVVTVPLEADDEVWADVIEDVVALRADRFAPDRVRAGFDASPFALADGPSPSDELWS